MKKLFLAILAFAFFTGSSIAQTPAADLIKAANKAVKGISGKKEKLAPAEAAIDAMMKLPENQTNWEALLIKGKFYNEQSSMDNLQQATADRKSTRLNSSHVVTSRMPSSA